MSYGKSRSLSVDVRGQVLLLRKNEHFVLCLELGGYSMKQNVDVLSCDVEFDPFYAGAECRPRAIGLLCPCTKVPENNGYLLKV